MKHENIVIHKPKATHKVSPQNVVELPPGNARIEIPPEDRVIVIPHDPMRRA